VQVAGRLSGPAAQTLQRGSTVNVAFALSSPTPASLTLALHSDNPGVASVPASIAISAGSSIATVPVTGVGPGTTVIHASAPPAIAESTVSVSVIAPSAITLPSGVLVPLQQSAPFPITLGTPAPPGGVVVTLTSSDPNTVSLIPASVFVSGGATVPAAQPQVGGVNIGQATVSASASGYATASATVGVTATITLSPQTLTIPVGGIRLLTIALSASAPSGVPVTPDRGSGGFVEGLTLQLTSSNPNVAQLQPSVQMYPDGSSITTVVVVISGIAPGTAVVHVNALPFIADVSVAVVVQ
jgi:hypothetical protein